MAKLFSAKMAGSTIRMDVGPGFAQAISLFSKGKLDEFQQALQVGMARAMDVLKDEWALVYTEGRADGPPLHGFTVEQKGHGRLLDETGEMARGLTVVVAKKSRSGAEFVLRVTGKAALKASVHEGGAVIRVTQKMRSFLAARGLRLKKTTRFLTIPPRPVREVALRQALPKMEDTINRHLRSVGFGA